MHIKDTACNQHKTSHFIFNVHKNKQTTHTNPHTRMVNFLFTFFSDKTFILLQRAMYWKAEGAPSLKSPIPRVKTFSNSSTHKHLFSSSSTNYVSSQSRTMLLCHVIIPSAGIYMAGIRVLLDQQRSFNKFVWPPAYCKPQSFTSTFPHQSCSS